jgi:NAD(P)-dependent dehydrogenase (short-subunit alcohol dehydrogenase family)
MMNVLITGANRGLGLGLATRFANFPGTHVFAAAREPDSGPELAALAAGHAGSVTIVRCDVAAADAGATLAAAIGAEKLDVLVNNAGVGGSPGFGQLTQDDLIAIFKVNTFAPLLIAQALRAAFAPGAKIVNISSVLGSIEEAGASYFAYGASKAALNMVTKKLAAELPEVAVLSLHPGWVRTRMGGDGAAIDVDTSADGMMRVIGALDAKRSGAFLAYDGSEIAW